MSQIGNEDSDGFNELDPLAFGSGRRSARPAPAAARPAGGRGRRAVIVDDQYNGQGPDAPVERANLHADVDFDADLFDEDASARGGRERRAGRDAFSGGARRGRSEPDADEAPAASARGRAAARTRGALRGAETTSRRAASRREGGSTVVRWAIVAGLVWVAAALAFAVGFYRLPVGSVGSLAGAAVGLPPQIQAMILAMVIGPLALIFMLALAGLRAEALAFEARRLHGAAQSAGDGGAGGRLDPTSLREEAENATRALSAMEAGFEAAEERAQLARDRLESERTALSRLVEDLDAQAARVSEIVSTLSDRIAVADGGSNGGGEARAFAQQLAGQIESGAAARRDADRDRVGATAGAHAPIDAFDDAPSLGESASAGGRYADEFDAHGRYDDDEFGEDYDGEDGDDGFDDPYRDGYGEDDEFEDAAPEAAGGRDDVAAAPRATPRAGELDWAKLVVAANFPDSEEDRETLDAIYAVLNDREAAALLQSAEDALSALADIGLFMEDMQPNHGPVELWRAFIVHDDRRDAMDLGGVRDPHAIEDVMTALRDKPEFLATIERFMERYEGLLARLFDEAPSPNMAVELADTRTGRAYMLVGRASGRFG